MSDRVEGGSRTTSYEVDRGSGTISDGVEEGSCLDLVDVDDGVVKLDRLSLSVRRRCRHH